MKKFYNNYINNDHSFDKTTMLGIFALIIVLAGGFGFLYEYIFYFFNGGCKMFYWRGGNFLPWINIYATGALLIYFLTYKKRKKPLKVFLLSFFSCGLLELVSGYFMDIIRHGDRCWDYNNEILNFGNIGGYVCLRSALIFGLCGLLLIYAVVPLCFYLAKKMKKKYFLILSFTLCSIVLIDEFYNLFFARIFHLPRAYDFHVKWGYNYVKFK